MPGTFSRVKVWVKERLRYSDLNGEFNNILNNMTPSGVDDASSDVTAMRAEADPAPGGTESLATSLLGELQRIRAVLRRLQGGSYWYSDVGTVLAANPSLLRAYIPCDGNTAAEVLVDYLQRRGLLNAVTMSAADVASSDFDGTNKKFGNYAMKVKDNAIFAVMAPGAQSFSLSAHFRNLATGDYIAYNPGLGLELYLDGSGFLTARLREQTAASETAKTFNTVAGIASRAANTNFQHVVVRARVNAVAGGGTDLLNLLLAGADEGTQINAVSIPAGVPAASPWFLGARPNDPTWDKFSAMLVNPDAEAVSPWTLSTSGAPSRAVATGVLTVSVAALEQLTFSRTSSVDLANMTVDTKFKMNSQALGHSVLLADVYDTSMSRSLTVQAEPGRLAVSCGFIGGRVYKHIPLDTSQWNHIRITSLGSPSPTTRIYVNGVQVMEFTNNQVTVVGADYFGFSVLGSTADASTVNFEHYAYISSVGATVYPPVQDAAAATGQIDDFAMVEEQLSASLISSLGSNSVGSVYRVERKPGLYSAPIGFGFLSGAQGADVSQLSGYIVSDGRTPLSLSMLAQAATSFTPAYGYDLRLLLATATETLILQSITSQYLGASVFNAHALSTTRMLPLGVYQLSVIVASFNVADTLSGNFNILVQKGREV